MRYSQIFATTILLLLSSSTVESLKILAIFPLNGKSHFVMCERLVKGLAEKGHRVDVYSHFPARHPIPNYRDHSLADSLPSLVNNMSYQNAVQFQAGNARKIFEHVGHPICELMARLPIFRELVERTRSRKHGYDLVIVEAFVASCYFAWGRHLDVPMIGVMTTFVMDHFNAPLGNPFNTAVTPGMGTDFFAPMTFWQRLTNTLVFQLVTGSIMRESRELDPYVEQVFGPGYPSCARMHSDLDLLLVNSHHSLDGIKPVTPAIVPVSGLHIVDDDERAERLPEDVQRWLDESGEHGCVYFSFGSMIRLETFPRATIEVFYETFARLAPVRVLLKATSPAELPPGLPGSVMAKSWFSQLRVLKHKNVKAFVTHGGLMSTQESLHCRVPMIGIPVFGDQHFNIESNVRRGIATAVPLGEISADKLTEAIAEVLRNPAYRKNIETLSRKFLDRPMKPLDTAIYWIEYVARHGKNALRSPVVDMPWWQASLLDVYGFVLFALAATFYALKFAARSAYGLCAFGRGGERGSLRPKKNQ